jgi:Fe-S-cluster containining protein
MEIDTTELEGLHFSCLDGCGLCCLCQPELIGNEGRVFLNDPDLKVGITGRTPFGSQTKNLSIKMKEGAGSCYFLRNRKCLIHDKRPYYCRIFPLSIHVGDRVQAVANRTCRGINKEATGAGCKEFLQMVLSEKRGPDLAQELGRTRAAFKAFYEAYLNDEQLKRDSIQNFSLRLLERSGFVPLTQHALTCTSLEDEIPQDLAHLEQFLDACDSPDLNTPALEGARQMFESADPVKLPAWPDATLQWVVYRMTGQDMERCILGDDGGLKVVRRLPLSDIRLKPIEKSGEAVMAGYARELMRRDLTYGYACYLTDLDHADESFLKIYIGTLGTLFLDYWWRCSMISAFEGGGTIDKKAATEGIIAYDMDYLDFPSLGGFI